MAKKHLELAAKMVESKHKQAKEEKATGDDKVETVMHEYQEGDLKSGSGKKVTDRKQAVAIALSEKRKKEGK